MYNGKKISVVFPAYNEREGIRRAVEDFSRPFVDEIIVVDNNSTDGTWEEASKTGCKVVRETRQGYGSAIKRGLKEATGDYIIVAEPDGTFNGRDLLKFIVYADDCDFIIGTRTRKEMIHPGANMGWFLRVGNRAVGEMFHLLFNGPRLSDAGCTFRLIKREALEKIYDQLTVDGSHFSPHMMGEGILNGLKMIEIPVNYYGRVGESTITGKKYRAFLLGLKMIFFLIGMKLRVVLGRRKLKVP